MAKRRMISKDIIQTQRFLRLPLEAQALYFHLVLSADDDGIVEAFPIVRMIGASEDSLGLLVVKRFITALNDEMVYFIIDFMVQNRIRKDRYTPSVYAGLLPQNETTATNSEQNGNQKADNDNHSIVQCSVVKSSIDTTTTNKTNNISKSDGGGGASDNSKNVYTYFQECFGGLNSINSQDLDYWVNDLSSELVCEAMKKAALKNAGYSYAQAIMKRWAKEGVRTLEQVKAEEAEWSNTHKANANAEYVEDYHAERDKLYS